MTNSAQSLALSSSISSLPTGSSARSLSAMRPRNEAPLDDVIGDYDACQLVLPRFCNRVKVDPSRYKQTFCYNYSLLNRFNINSLPYATLQFISAYKSYESSFKL